MIILPGLPCNCDGTFSPVCGVNGKTYPNSCLARCTSLQEQQYESGACASKDPCHHNPCPLNTKYASYASKLATRV